MKLNVELDPREEVRIKLKEEGEVPYTVRIGQQVFEGTVVVSEELEPSGVRVIVIFQDPASLEFALEAPDPVVIRKNRTMAWSNKTTRKVRVKVG